MLFSSPIFLFYFLPILIVLYFTVRQRFKNILLLSASLLFYAWGEGFYVLLMLSSISINYFIGRLINTSDKSLCILSAGITANLLILISYKYSNFIVDNFNLFITFFELPEIILAPVHLPLGISFFTFQAMSYLIDIYRREIPSQSNIIKLGLYISLFPQLIAGPIVRYKTVINEIDNRRVSPKMFVEGAERFIFGLAKKMLIANPLGYVVDVIFEVPFSELPTHIAWLGIMLYALQIYFDFSGYSDMAIGLGRMFGFKFLENFNYPYSAQSLQEFWRKWHISLSTWFRDYLYFPLGGNRGSPFRTYCNLFAVFLLCGIWHGASWNFFVWGAFHGGVLTIERAGFSNFLSRLWQPLRHFYLIFVVLISWVFFRVESLEDAVTYLDILFSFNNFNIPFEVLDVVNINVILALVFGIILSVPTFRSASDLLKNSAPSISATFLYTSTRIILALVLLLFSSMELASTTHNPFIYFRF